MIGLAFTTTEAAAPFLKQYRQGRLRELSEGEHTYDDDVLVTITGVGKIKATLRTERLLQEFALDRLIHPGTCTALTDELDAGTLVGITHVLEGDRIQLSAPSYPRMPLDQPFEAPAEGTLVTHDHGIGNQDERSYWQRIADLSDATGYAIAYVAAQHGVPCSILMVPTGRVLEENEDFRQQLHDARETVAAFLIEQIESGVLTGDD
jgi:nucleoside phosphorylase